MAVSAAFFRHRLVSRGCRVLLALGVAVSAPAAQAANAADWWVYLANNHPDEINALLARGADPNVRYGNGQPALMRAVVERAWEVFDALAADSRTDVNVENPAGETPLMYLAIAGQTARARGLIARGAQVNRLGWTPLHYAASKAQLAMARLLLEHKAMVNAPAPEGQTPLMMAALSGSSAMAALLLEAGADVTTRDSKGQDASDWARAGKSGSLAADLQTLIVQQEAAKRARRAKNVAASESRGDAVTPMPPGGAPARRLGGVSGVRLNDYDAPATP